MDLRRDALSLKYAEIARLIGTSHTKVRDFFNGTGVNYSTFIDIGRALGYDIERYILLNSEKHEVPDQVKAALYDLRGKILDIEEDAIISYAKAGGFRDASKDVVLAWLGDLRAGAGRKPSDVLGEKK